MSTLQEISNALPPRAQHELFDFAEFLQRKYGQGYSAEWPERADWIAMTESSVTNIWDNTEDDVYGRLL